ncbi:MAG TPA: hypothetical protein VF147_14490 [Vicinamibacterales bacterium]
MKTIIVPAVALLTVLTASPRADQQVARELQPSLDILKTVSTPMPDFHGVKYYQAMPDSGGDLSNGIGHSDWVRGWFRQMDPMTAQFTKHDQKLEADVDVYGDTVREEGDKVLAATANLKQALQPVAQQVHPLLVTYRKEVRAAQDARSKFNAAGKEVERATFLLDASDNAAKECNAQLEKAKLEADKAVLLARLEKGAAFLNAVEKALDAAAGGPQSMVAYVAGEAETMTRQGAKALILEAFYSGTREQLYDIGLKIEAIDKSLMDLKCKAQASTLKASKADLEARLIEVVVAFAAIVDHRARAWEAVDGLALLKDPQTGRKIAFFQALQEYNKQVNFMGHTVHDSVNAYMEFLSKAPLSRGPAVFEAVKEDMETVDSERAKRDPRGEWLSRASETKAYLERYTDWYEAEVARGQMVIANLREGRHLDFVDRMLARTAKEIGSTVSLDDIIR